MSFSCSCLDGGSMCITTLAVADHFTVLVRAAHSLGNLVPQPRGWLRCGCASLEVRFAPSPGKAKPGEGVAWDVGPVLLRQGKRVPCVWYPYDTQ